MRRPVRTHRFKKDVDLARRRGKDLGKLRWIMERLIAEELLPDRYRDHPLIGNYVGRRECHVELDWLLIYKLEGKDILFERTGTHADLFR
ncbi:MAG: type II toxin-antitoxin system YafQ family toxin, partial [Gammaproteobacteria bacterium]